MPTATGFIDANTLTIHFNEHGQDFNATNEADYLAQAKAFIETPIVADSTIVERVRTSNGDILRFDNATETFASVQSNGLIRTFFRPMPMHLAPPGTPRRKMHRFSSNYDYFLDTCSK